MNFEKIGKIRDYFLMGFLIVLFLTYSIYFLFHLEEINFHAIPVGIGNLTSEAITFINNDAVGLLNKLFIAVCGTALVLAIVALFFLPTIIADRRHHKNARAIAVVNLLFGWTFIGWAIALIWASTDTGNVTPTYRSVNSIDKLKELSGMKEQELITQAEFDAKKKKILDGL